MNAKQKRQQDKIQQMINFIQNEAKDKAEEIEVETAEQCAIEKQNLVEEASKNIRAEYEKKEKDVEIQKQIQRSNEIKAARLTVLQLKEQVMNDIVAETRNSLMEILKDQSKYKKLLSDLILQALLALGESQVHVFCKEEDKSLIEGLIDDVAAIFAKKSGIQCQIEVMDRNYLPSNSCGGVIVSALNDKIRVNNTLEERIRLAYEQNVPHLRKILFPKKTTF